MRKKHLIVHILLVLFAMSTFYSCLDKDRGTLRFVDKTASETSQESGPSQQDFQKLEQDLWREKIEREKSEDWQKIVDDAKESYSSVSEIVERKCLDCHDSHRRLPFYGRIFPSKNPVNKHQVEGLKALDFAGIFPLKAQGNPPQLSLLKAIRASIVERTMPLKSYTLVYPFRKVREKDENKFLLWLDPLIEEIENFNVKYQDLKGPKTLEERVTDLFSNKCFRCHGNGNARGGFGNMNNYDSLFKNSKAVNTESIELSPIYTLSVSGSMPTNPRERLTAEELSTMLEWLAQRLK